MRALSCEFNPRALSLLEINNAFIVLFILSFWMILELPRGIEHFGAVRFHDIQRVYELDSGMRKFRTKAREAVATISSEDIGRINEKMAIVIPIKDEKLRLLEGVLSGIPHDCHVIVVSGSQRSPADRFMMEVQMLKQFNHFVEIKSSYTSARHRLIRSLQVRGF